MIKIIPAILPSSYRAIEAGVEKVYEIVDTVQIDFVDGHFANNRTWWFNNKDTETLSAILREEQGLPYWDTVNYELDLMVADPLQYIDTFVALGPSKIIFHIEGLDIDKMGHYFEALPEITKSTISFGIALGVDTDPKLITPLAPYIDTIQCMGIARVGFQGESFDPRVIEQIKAVKALFPDKTISVDGAVTLDTASLLVQAGATTLVVGSAIFQSTNLRGTIEALQHLWQPETTVSEN